LRTVLPVTKLNHSITSGIQGEQLMMLQHPHKVVEKLKTKV